MTFALAVSSRHVTALGLGIVLFAATAGAGSAKGFASAETLRTWCQGKGSVQASCLGYLAGVVDALGAAPPCLPPKLAVQQVRDLFLNHLHRNPERGEASAAGEVRAALVVAFPCPETPPRGSERVS